MENITKRLCNLIDFDIERRLKKTIEYCVEEDEYPAISIASKEAFELFPLVESEFSPSTKVLSIFDFGSGIGNVLAMLYNAAIAHDYSRVKLIGIEKYRSITNEAKKYLNHCHIPEENYMFHIKDLKKDLQIFMPLLMKQNVLDSKFSQNLVFCNRLFRDSFLQVGLEKSIVEFFPIGTVFIFYMPAYCVGKSTEMYTQLGLKQINQQIFVKVEI